MLELKTIRCEALWTLNRSPSGLTIVGAVMASEVHLITEHFAAIWPSAKTRDITNKLI
jgi:hypothetical protein